MFKSQWHLLFQVNVHQAQHAVMYSCNTVHCYDKIYLIISFSAVWNLEKQEQVEVTHDWSKRSNTCNLEMEQKLAQISW